MALLWRNGDKMINFTWRCEDSMRLSKVIREHFGDCF